MEEYCVGYQGEPGAYSEIAALRFEKENKAFEDFKHIFQAISAGEIKYGAIPLENSLGGSIHQNYDYLMEFPVSVIAETYVSIEHCLMGLPGASIKKATHVLSHPQALMQCKDFLDAHPNLKAEATYDTAGSAKLIAETKSLNQLAIASKRAAELYGLNIIETNLADAEWNITRFVCIAKKGTSLHPNVNSQERKTSLVFLLPNEQGSLFNAMATLALRKIDLTKIESRPSRKKAFEYLFYVDIIGSPDEANVQHALSHLEEISPMVKVLGSYGKVM